ncbi:MAG: hypothetical protein IK064_06535, partial [Clostridia bacterium]|nr:hypothetical protein [Clostridia bacterium]
MAILALLLLICACTAGEKSADSAKPTEPPAPTQPAAPTEPPEPTEPPAPPEPTEPPADLPDWMVMVDESDYAKHRAAAEAILAGNEPEPFAYSGPMADCDGVFFDLETDYTGSYLTAYSTRVSVEYSHLVPGEDGDLHARGYRYTGDPVARYPFGLARRAQSRIAEYMLNYGHLSWYQEEESLYPMPGFCGEDWIIVMTQTDVRTQVHTIWRTDDGENWYEFGSANGVMAPTNPTVLGAEIVSDKVGFICLYSYIYDESRYTHAFATYDGGETWSDLCLTLPDEYSDYTITELFCPAFEGDHGVILCNACFREDDIDGDLHRLYGWFET